MKIRDAIFHSLWAGAALLLVSLVAYIIWITLQSMGDHPGAAGARGVACVAFILWAINFVVLVVLSAIAHLVPEENESSPEH